MGWDLLCYSLLLALQQLPSHVSARAVGTFLKVVELSAGHNLMTRATQVAALVRLGSCAGSLACRDVTLGEKLRAKIAVGLVPGTSDGDVFADAYLSTLRDKRS